MKSRVQMPPLLSISCQT